MVDFSTLMVGDIVEYTEHEATNPDYFGHEAVVLNVVAHGRDARVELEVVDVHNGEKFKAKIYDPSRIELANPVMFADIKDVSSVHVGDILYFKRDSRTTPDYWGFAARVEDVDEDYPEYVTVVVPNVDVVRRISADEWNENPDFDGDDVHTEDSTSISRLAMLVGEINSSQELDDFLRSV